MADSALVKQQPGFGFAHGHDRNGVDRKALSRRFDLVDPWSLVGRIGVAMREYEICRRFEEEGGGEFVRETLGGLRRRLMSGANPVASDAPHFTHILSKWRTSPLSEEPSQTRTKRTFIHPPRVKIQD